MAQSIPRVIPAAAVLAVALSVSVSSAQQDVTPVSYESPFSPPAIEPVGEAAVGYEPILGPGVQLERGRPNKLVDGVGWVLGIPRKLLLWDRRVENHQVSEQTEQEVALYLSMHELDEVMVRVNQYDPGGEWRRLADNKRVGAGWRYTVGALTTLAYTVFPGRLVGNDSYNPYTDTVHIYSDVPALALEQAAYARDVHERERPGTYAAVQGLPLVGLWHESRSKHEVHEFLSFQGTPQEQAEAHRILDPQFGTEIGGQFGSLVPGVDLPLQLTGAAVGHVVGNKKADEILRE